MSTRGIRRQYGLKPVRRDDKIKEWAENIQDAVRHYGGTRIGDAEAVDYADQFWRSLESRSTPIMSITTTPGTQAVEWVLATFKASLVAATTITDTERTE